MKRSEFIALLAAPFLTNFVKTENDNGLFPTNGSGQNSKVLEGDCYYLETTSVNAVPGNLVVDENENVYYCISRKENVVRLYKTEIDYNPIGKKFVVFCIAHPEI